MSKVRSAILALGTMMMALAIGFVMQQSAPVADSREYTVASFVPTSSAVTDAPVEEAAQEPVILAAVTLDPAPAPTETTKPLAPIETAETAAPACDISLTATAAPAAMVTLALSAPCQPNSFVTFHHSGLMFDAQTDDAGALTVQVPALSEAAVFIAAFDSGDGAVAQTQVPSLPFYDRVAVQWSGTSGVQLHARQFGAAYWSAGHIWNDNAGDPVTASTGESGFLTQLGTPQSTTALQAEIYSYPAGTTRLEGTIALTVETEITEANCGKPIEAQTLELREGGALRTQDLTVEIPDCAATGDFLVLKNMLEDLTIALN
ncbi:translocase [Pseudoprimorskyibacter insulae]|uniref:Translocase n=1 Tax=Pseudoprimorskyibacter insulae TaxID=1695997 RepID=A0A2R8AU22_9RHOB|nr:translocase [Pseudoprimorskyibacter insulae]SPF79543.1 hypothetical protein PRI8871_01339 [Pseudoprimorskyibacter insulae]